MEKLEKRLGKLWRRVRRGKKKRTEEEREEVGTSSPKPARPPLEEQERPSKRTDEFVIHMRPRKDGDVDQNHLHSVVPKVVAARLSRNGSNRSERTTDRLRTKSGSPRIVVSSDDDDLLIHVDQKNEPGKGGNGSKRPIVRRRSSKKNQPQPTAEQPVTNPQMLKLYYLAGLQQLRDRIRHPVTKSRTSTMSSGASSTGPSRTPGSPGSELQIRIPGDGTFSGESTELGSGYLSDVSLLSSLPRLGTSRKTRDLEFDESSGYESGYMSNLELVTPDFLSRSEPDSLLPAPLSPPLRFRLSHKPFHKSATDAIHVEQLSPAVLPRSVTLARLPPTPTDPVDAFLRNNIYKTKFITCVFEAVNGGLDALLDDAVDELHRWFGKRLLGVACEIHWTVPEKYRSRRSESQLKDAVHRVLRENNRRLLNLEGPHGKLPIKLAEAETRENCRRNQETDAFEGAYQRCYSHLLPYSHEETPNWHQPYWNVDSLNRNTALRPRPLDFVFGSPSSDLRRTTVLALNIAGLHIRPPRSKSARDISY